MKNHIIAAEIHWSDRNYCCGWACPEFGAVIVTARTMDDVKRVFESSLVRQIDDMAAAGEEIPAWLAVKEYKIEYLIQVSALLREASKYTSMANLSRITGINQKLLSNYASSVKIPRESQKRKIIDGLHEIGRACLML